MKIQFFQGLALTAVCAAAMFAQTTTTTHTAPTPAEMAANQVVRLTSLLTLSSAQQASATSIFTQEYTTLATLQTSMQTARTALTTAITGNATATISTEAAAIGSLTTQEVQAQAAAQAAFYQVLTADQQTKYAAMLTRGPGMGGPGGFGGPGPRFRGGRQ